MSTITEAASSGQIVKVTMRGALEFRSIYALPKVIQWMRADLPNLESDGYVEGALAPSQQLHQQIKAFVRGDSPDNWMIPKLLRPTEHGVWEMRTYDLRVFGWFYRKGTFIISSILPAAECKERDLYLASIQNAVKDREALELAPPPFEEGELHDLF